VKFTYDPRPIMKQWPTQGPKGPKAASVEGSPEQLPVQGVAAVATGSLPAWWRELFPLIEKWEEKAKGYANDAKYHEYRGSCELRREYNALWSAHKSCAEELRRQMAAAIKRQPEENNASQQRAD
jgi:hypothetical protein